LRCNGSYQLLQKLKKQLSHSLRAYPGVLFRSIAELRCWFSTIFGTDVSGQGEVWDSVLTFTEQNTSTCTPLITQQTSVPYPRHFGVDPEPAIDLQEANKKQIF
jgi:hypothetical protein